MLQIRKVKPEDVQFVWEMAEKGNWSREQLSVNLDGFLICESDGVKCGCGCLINNEGIGILNWVEVIEGYRGRRLGTAIVKALLNIADRNMITDVYTAIPSATPGEGCARFLASLEFRPVDGMAERDKIQAVLGEGCGECYHVSLEGYFKPCSEK
jgi:N-acetylglutamate synthase-like GNAT family acetyltransferase